MATAKKASPKAPYASVVMPTYNKAEYLALTLASFEKLETDRYEIVLVDDGSTDGTREVIARYQSRLPLVALHQANAGRSAARNLALKEARGQLIIFSDDDRIVTPGFVRAHLEAHRGAARRVVIGWMKGVMTRWDPALLTPALGLELSRAALEALIQRNPTLRPVLRGKTAVQLVSEEQLLRRFKQTLRSLEVPEPVFTMVAANAFRRYSVRLRGFKSPWGIATTGNLSVARSLITKVGGFETAFEGWGFEDTEYTYRMFRAGAVFRGAPKALSFHQMHPRHLTEDSIGRAFVRFLTIHPRIEVLLYGRMLAGEFDLQGANDILTAAHSGPPGARLLADAYLRECLRQIAIA